MTAPSITRRRRAGAVALAAAGAIAAAVLSGCGASNTIDPVARAADLSATAPGYRMVFTMRENFASLPVSIAATGTGSFDVAQHAGRFAMAMKLPATPAVTRALGGSQLNLQEVVRGSAVYVKMPAALMSRLGGAGKPWLKLDLSKLPGAQGSMMGAIGGNPLSGDPSQLLSYLRGSGGVTTLGHERVAGQSTTHYRGHISFNLVAQRAPSADRTALARGISQLEAMGIPKQIPVEVWVDGTGLVRKLEMTLDATIRGQAMHMVMQELIPQYGPQPIPALPPAGRVTDASGMLGAM